MDDELEGGETNVYIFLRRKNARLHFVNRCEKQRLTITHTRTFINVSTHKHKHKHFVHLFICISENRCLRMFQSPFHRRQTAVTLDSNSLWPSNPRQTSAKRSRCLGVTSSPTRHANTSLSRTLDEDKSRERRHAHSDVWTGSMTLAGDLQMLCLETCKEIFFKNLQLKKNY